jgi:hypothetical protein
MECKVLKIEAEANGESMLFIYVGLYWTETDRSVPYG